MMFVTEKRLSPDELLRQAERMRSLATSEAFRELMAGAETDVHAEWARARTPQDRENAAMQLMGLRAILTRLQTVMNRAAEAEAELKVRNAIAEK